MTANTEVAILDRLIQLDADGLTPEAARFLLTVTFRSEDHERMNELAAKARDANLAGDEQEELEEYRRAGDTLALLHSKARRLLRQAEGS